jgi:hypothetical protein
MKIKPHRLIIACVLFLVCLVSAGQAQQNPPSPQPSQNPATEPTSTQDPSVQAPAPSAESQSDNSIATSAPPVRTMNGASPLPSGRVSAVQFGPVYLQSADFLQTFDAINATGQPNTTWQDYSIFRATAVFDQAYKHSHVAVQYQPRLLIVDGVVHTDTADLNAAWSTLLPISPRLSVSLNNGLIYYSRVGQFDNLDLMSDITTGALAQSNFLEGGGHFLDDRTDLAFKYQLSARSRFDVTPFFQYYYSTGTQAIGDSYGFGLNADYGYLLSPTKNVTFIYQIDDTHFSQLIPTTTYQTFAINYAQQLSPTWRFSVGGGATTSGSYLVSATPNTQPTRSAQWTENGLFNLIKTFSNSSLAFSYYRGQAAGVQITNGFADRYDLSFQSKLTPRLGMALGAGYYREFLSATDTSGIYSTAGLDYGLTERWFLQLQYGYKHQQNGGATYQTGDLQFVSLGIRWQPGQRQGGR